MIAKRLAIAALCLLPCHAWTQVLPLEIRGHRIDYNPFTLVAMPGEQLQLGIDPGGKLASDVRVRLDDAATGQPLDGDWLLDAPEKPGLYQLLVEVGDGRQARINLFVNVPEDRVRNEQLNGYKLGPSPPGHSHHPGLYTAPAGYLEVTDRNLDTQLSPHFRLRQFLCKQAGGYPKYVVLQESLLVFLEGLLRAVNEAGYPVETFGVISGYRTPWYNKSIGNVPNSRHVYGDAMDLFIDMDGDGGMDDLNRDGRRDRDDIDLLASLAEQFMQRPENRALVGGVGRYGKTRRHGGFVHVDTRGFRARW